MTCEISIMNRQAIALAADSATTVTEWIDGKEQQRFFKGANKIFQLSNDHQVGMMIFGSATLHDIPWELLIKDFRLKLGTQSYDELSGYADRFFASIASHQLFSREYQEKISKAEILKVAYLHLFLIDRKCSESDLATDEEKKKKSQDLLLIISNGQRIFHQASFSLKTISMVLLRCINPK